jgi:hypothetical protein
LQKTQNRVTSSFQNLVTLTFKPVITEKIVFFVYKYLSSLIFECLITHKNN